jgi:hypothetical protein
MPPRLLPAPGFEEALLRHHGAPVRPPQRPEWGPDRKHGREVFRGEPRHQAQSGR